MRPSSPGKPPGSIPAASTKLDNDGSRKGAVLLFPHSSLVSSSEFDCSLESTKIGGNNGGKSSSQVLSVAIHKKTPGDRA